MLLKPLLTGMLVAASAVARVAVACVLAICLAAIVGCAGIGARSIAHDRFDYAETLSASWKQQMLANMVKLRYGDTPVFLDVASVINQYSIETQVDLRLSWTNPQITTGDSQSTGAAARYIDRPTITYTPLSGERFARSLMKPIPPPAVLSLIQAGYPIDAVLRTCVHSINGVRNRHGGAGQQRIIAEVDHSRREVIARPPVGVNLAQLVGGKRLPRGRGFRLHRLGGLPGGHCAGHALPPA